MLLAGSSCVGKRTDSSERNRGKYGSALLNSDEPGVELGPRDGNGVTVELPGARSSTTSNRTDATKAPIDDNGRLGINTRLYLSREVPKLVVEVDALEGYEPDPSALEMLRTRLASIVDKPGGVEMLPVETFSGDRSPWSEGDLLDVEKRNRDRYSTRSAMVLYVVYVNGAYSERPEALGLAYDSSTFAIFVERIREAAATPLVSSASIEQAVVVHEMGHVLALVNLGYESPRDHEDPQHRGHSSNPESVMYWAMDNVGVANLLGGRTTPPDDFDSDDRADLEDLKEGKLRVG